MFRFLQQAAFVSSGGPFSDQVSSGSIFQLSRVQNLDFDFDFPYSNEIYTNDGFSTQQIQRAVVNFSFEYLATAGLNERRIGFNLDQALVGAFTHLNNEKNYYFQSEDQTVDANFANSSPAHVIGIGHALLNGYSIAGSVGGLLRVTCAGQGLNAVIYTGTSGDYVPTINTETAEPIELPFILPAADSQLYTGDSNPANRITALGARDLLLSFPSGSAFATVISGDGCILQSFNLAFSLDRNEARCLGHAYPSSRPVSGPIQVAFSVEAVLNQFNVARLSDLRCDGHNIDLLVGQPCVGNEVFGFRLRDLRLESQSFSVNIEGMQTVQFSWNGMVNLHDLRVTMSGAGSLEETPAFVPQLEYYQYETFDDYVTGESYVFGLNWTYALSGLSGEATGIWQGRTTGYMSATSGYASDMFELYSVGQIFILNKGTGFSGFLGQAGVGYPGFYTGYFTGYHVFFADGFEYYPTGILSLFDSGIASGHAQIGTGYSLDIPP